MTIRMEHEILLETGTNEVEIAEFMLGVQSFGINVAKIKEFVPYSSVNVTKDPNAPKSMTGVFMLRGSIIPLIDLAIHLKQTQQTNSDRRVILVTEFNEMTCGFVVDAIHRIVRVSWGDLKPVNPVLKKHTSRLVGSIHESNSDILILDIEYILAEIFPDRILKHAKPNTTSDHSQIKLIIVEDSSLARDSIKKSFEASGYKSIIVIEDGKKAYNLLLKLKEEAANEGKTISDKIQGIICDIEMPQMDGLTLCKKVREELNLVDMPFIIFSSLITEQMALKCESVGATAYTIKPNIDALLQLVDKHCLKKSK